MNCPTEQSYLTFSAPWYCPDVSLSAGLIFTMCTFCLAYHHNNTFFPIFWNDGVAVVSSAKVQSPW